VIGSKLPLSWSIQAAITKYHKLRWLINNKFISHSSGGWEVQDMVLADLVYDEGPLPGSSMAVFSLCPHTAERAKELSGVSFINDAYLIMRALLS